MRIKPNIRSIDINKVGQKVEVYWHWNTRNRFRALGQFLRLENKKEIIIVNCRLQSLRRNKSFYFFYFFGFFLFSKCGKRYLFLCNSKISLIGCFQNLSIGFSISKWKAGFSVSKWKAGFSISKWKAVNPNLPGFF